MRLHPAITARANGTPTVIDGTRKRATGPVACGTRQYRGGGRGRRVEARGLAWRLLVVEGPSLPQSHQLW
jgi:hypothetical protein